MHPTLPSGRVGATWVVMQATQKGRSYICHLERPACVTLNEVKGLCPLLRRFFAKPVLSRFFGRGFYSKPDPSVALLPQDDRGEGLRMTSEELRMTSEELRMTSEGLRMTEERFLRMTEGRRFAASNIAISVSG